MFEKTISRTEMIDHSKANLMEYAIGYVKKFVRAKFYNSSFTIIPCINRYENYTRASCSSSQTSGKVLNAALIR